MSYAFTIFVSFVVLIWLSISVFKMRRHLRQVASWHRQGRFDPIVPVVKNQSGYAKLTDTFSAKMTVHRYLAAFRNENVRMSACAFAYGYLATRLGQNIADHQIVAPHETSASIDHDDIFGWLANIHNEYPDNAPCDSETVLSALRTVISEYQRGRSLNLQRQSERMAIVSYSNKLDPEDNRQRFLAQQAKADMNVSKASIRIAHAINEGIEIAQRHTELH